MLVLIYGENSFLSKQKLSEYLKLPSIVFDYSQEDFFTLFSEKASETPLFGDPPQIIIKGLIKNAKADLQKKVLSFLESHTGLNTIIFYEESEALGRSSLFNYLKKEAELFLFEKWKKPALKSWATNEFKNEGYTIDKEALELLLDFLGDDPWLIYSEINKLKLASGEDKKISLALVKEQSLMQTSANIFDFVDSIGYRNKKRALSLARRLFAHSESAFGLFSMIVRQFRMLSEFVDLRGRGVSQPEIIKQMKLSPFISGKIAAQAKFFNRTELQSIYNQLVEIDVGIKTGDDPELKIEQLIFKICK